MAQQTFAEQLAAAGQFKDQAQYNSLKESHEREVEGTRKLYERLKREHGDAVARAMLTAKGFDVALLS